MSPEATKFHVNDQVLTIRRATQVDIDNIVALLVEGFSDVAEKYASVRKLIKNVKTQISIELMGSNACILVACVNSSSSDAILGCAGVKLNSEAHAEVQHMAVTRACRGVGLGRLMLQAVINRIPLLSKVLTKSDIKDDNECKNLKIDVHLSVVYELEAARSLYASVGFVEKERETHKDGCLLIHMTMWYELPTNTKYQIWLAT